MRASPRLRRAWKKTAGRPMCSRQSMTCHSCESGVHTEPITSTRGIGASTREEGALTGVTVADTKNTAFEVVDEVAMHQRIIGFEVTLQFGVPLDVDLQGIRADFRDAIGGVFDEVKDILEEAA